MSDIHLKNIPSIKDDWRELKKIPYGAPMHSEIPVADWLASYTVWMYHHSIGCEQFSSKTGLRENDESKTLASRHIN